MIIIIDYGMGNLHSVYKAFKRAGSEVKISSNLEEIKEAEKLVLPGVGHFKKGMENLEKLNLIKTIKNKVLKEKTPILGICLGMQLLTDHSEEGDTSGLSLIKGKTIKFNLKDLKIPHMGWNSILIKKKNCLIGKDQEQYYFVHSYYVVPENKEEIMTTSIYGIEFCSSVQKDNIFATQFHPEKSHSVGLDIIKNFIQLKNV